MRSVDNLLFSLVGCLFEYTFLNRLDGRRHFMIIYFILCFNELYQNYNKFDKAKVCDSC